MKGDGALKLIKKERKENEKKCHAAESKGGFKRKGDGGSRTGHSEFNGNTLVIKSSGKQCNKKE